MLLLDTNLVVIFLTGYNQHGEFDEAKLIVESDEKMTMPVVVIHELTHVLPAVIKNDRATIVAKLIDFMRRENFMIEEEEKAIIFAALELWSTAGLDFVDCLLLAQAQRSGDLIATFDKRLKAEAGVYAH